MNVLPSDRRSPLGIFPGQPGTEASRALRTDRLPTIAGPMSSIRVSTVVTFLCQTCRYRWNNEGPMNPRELFFWTLASIAVLCASTACSKPPNSTAAGSSARSAAALCPSVFDLSFWNRPLFGAEGRHLDMVLKDPRRDCFDAFLAEYPDSNSAEAISSLTRAQDDGSFLEAADASGGKEQLFMLGGPGYVGTPFVTQMPNEFASASLLDFEGRNT